MRSVRERIIVALGADGTDEVGTLLPGRVADAIALVDIAEQRALGGVIFVSPDDYRRLTDAVDLIMNWWPELRGDGRSGPDVPRIEVRVVLPGMRLAQ